MQGTVVGVTTVEGGRPLVPGCNACLFNHGTTPAGLLHTHPVAQQRRGRSGKWLRRLWEQQDRRCAWCREPVEWGWETVEPWWRPSRDHLWPKMWGGPEVWWNEACAHSKCNEAREDTVGPEVEALLVARIGERDVKRLYRQTREVFALDMRWHTEHVLAVIAAEPVNRASHVLVEVPGGARASCSACRRAGRALYDRPCPAAAAAG
jgi:hypothetical protein